MSKEKRPRTVIRFGATHNEVVTANGNRQELGRLEDKDAAFDRYAMVREVCDTHGIRDPEEKQPTRRGKKR